MIVIFHFPPERPLSSERTLINFIRMGMSPGKLLSPPKLLGTCPKRVARACEREPRQGKRVKNIFKPQLAVEELNRCAVVFVNLPFFAKDSYPSSLFNLDHLLVLVDQVGSPYNFLCRTVGIRRRISKAKEIG